MTKGTTIAVSIGAGLLFLGGMIALWYHFVYKPENAGNGTGTKEGDACTKDGKEGTIQGGICITTKNPILNPEPVALPFIKGQNVYLNPTASFSGTSVASGIPIYRLPIPDAVGTYLVGVTRPDWYAPNPIGKYVEQGGNSNYSKIALTNIQIFKFSNGQYTNQTENITGDYFIHNKEIQKTPY